MLRTIQRLSDNDFFWQPPNGANSIAWLMWHIPEVEDNWVRDKLLGLPKRYPFGMSVKASSKQWPTRDALISYFHEVRALSKKRLTDMREDDFDRVVADEHFGTITARQLWGGVVTSSAWHSGQIVLIANRLLPRSSDRAVQEELV